MARTTNLKIRISPEEETTLRQQAAEANCNLSDLIRRKLGLDAVPPMTIRIQQAKATQAARKAGLALCIRCVRIGVPSCPSCLKAAMG